MSWNFLLQNGRHNALLNRLPTLVTLLLLGFLAWQLAAWTLLLVPLPMPRLSAEPAAIATANLSATTDMQADSRSNLLDARQIAALHLFGQVQAVPVPETVVEAPETRLNLRLAGIFYRQDNSALALIAEGSAPEQVYREGDLLSGGVSVHQIQTDKVILARAGQLEALSLPRESDSRKPAGPATSGGGGGFAPAAAEMINARAVAELLRDQVAANPAALEQLAFAAPYMAQGQFAGLQLRQGRDRRLLGRLGLRNGDILTEVNGAPVTDPIQGLTMLQNLFSEDQVQIKILRNGREIPFVFLLTQ
ncbi:MAG: type II secretion system protein N [Gammaproteobacteria bacterium]